MFEAAVTEFAKSVGGDVLIPSPSLTEADECEVLNVVVKKTRRWFWQSAKYQPTDFKLEDILRENVTENIPRTTCELLPSFKKTHKLAFKGKLGTKLMILWEIEAKKKGTFDLETDFVNIQQCEMHMKDAVEIINGR